jgi:hypothetical protein
MMVDVAACSSCGAPITWARTSSGKAIPLDAGPDPTGNLLVVDRHGTTLPAPVARAAVERGYATVMVARRGHRSIDPDLPHWRSHFSTCPHAHRHRTRTVKTAEVTTEPGQLPLL